jgi:peptidoglycan/xylan/chitin deacetylase (PgdA/CDA1 family)
MFFRTPSLLPVLFPQLIWRADSSEKKIFLTFDDGPIPGPTEFVLDTLRSFHAKATFFCIGDNVRKHPQIFEKITESGHAIGNHTFNHIKGWGSTTSQYVENIKLCEAEFDKFSNRTIIDQSTNQKKFRPPYGRITLNQISALKEYQIIMWDVLTRDYSKSYTPQQCLHYSVNAARQGSIVVFHDSLKAEKNLTFALPRLIEHFSKMGFSFEALP